MSETVYVVVDVGCIECGEGTDVRLFSSEVVAEIYRDEQAKWQRENWSGEHRFVLFALTVDGPSATIVSATPTS